LSQQGPKVVLSARQRAIVARLARSRTEPHRVVERAQIVLRSAEGDLCVEQARALGINAQRVRRWRKRFAEQREVLSRIEAESPEEDDARSSSELRTPSERRSPFAPSRPARP